MVCAALAASVICTATELPSDAGVMVPTVTPSGGTKSIAVTPCNPLPSTLSVKLDPNCAAAGERLVATAPNATPREDEVISKLDVVPVPAEFNTTPTRGATMGEKLV